ncbi:MAG: MFS transporter [Bifidobacterium tibiigranuli]|jgi:MFS family permease|uniref:MFS transporter n=1 Tax=Bifidobacterium tibiigranuli TaxID=2172043 RepID=UPI0026F346CE|nr:MFS transporter [Bifidobacterium tibiigranuli]MCI1673273.1 MFS transporter [Bifidobacterium tibiigranuli]MCI1712616.1 MFS transporter [Bifidobacterium tibiigranuli]MCI1833789.1 MFS transporter [Bifidobacterium tibiigranuli]
MSGSQTHTDGGAALSGALGFLVFNELASGFTQGFYTPLIPDIAHALNVNDAAITWFLTAQSLAAAVCVPLLSRLGDMFGHRRMLRIAILVVVAGSVIVALLPSFPVVLIARILQGPIAVWLPLEVAIIHGRASGQTARTGIGLLVACLTGGAIVGTVAAGLVNAHSPSLMVTLAVPVLVQAIAVYAVFVKIPESPIRTPGNIDVPGFVGLAVIMVALLGGLTLVGKGGVPPAESIGILLAALAAGAVWVLWELRASSPAIDVRLLASRRAAPIHITGFMLGLVMFGSQSPLTTFLSADPQRTGYGFAASSSRISLVVAAITLLATLGSALSARIAKLTSMRWTLVLGTLLAMASCIFVVVAHTSMWQVWVYAAIAGFGMGLLMGGLPALLAERTPEGQTGASVGVYNSLRSLGGSTGGALFGAVLGALTPVGSKTAGLDGYLVMWGLCAIAFLIGAAGLLTLRRSAATTAAR